jgi:hypothetical protein
MDYKTKTYFLINTLAIMFEERDKLLKSVCKYSDKSIKYLDENYQLKRETTMLKRKEEQSK